MAGQLQRLSPHSGIVSGLYHEAVSRLNNLAQRYDSGSAYAEVLIANYDTGERLRERPTQPGLFEEWAEQADIAMPSLEWMKPYQQGGTNS
ncbi:hypothetical protein [Paenibacillus tyrfis]|uniref:Uncharacterized protein n=1 Tax=Paenibacillus tyrfis TaxID=1501230 RepID=A0A081NXV8_9BACL|nr:hypothetical protein [Paenibacillus tyrfis]KEQ23281.1 hypothetical protein ET33_18185 [Paenibacillus tyrfis]